MPKARIHHREPSRDARHQLTFECGSELRRRLRLYAAQTDAKIYLVIREAVERYLEERGA